MILFKGTSCFCLGYKCEFVEISTQNHVTFQINIFSSNILSKVEWMNEWINESNNERMNEWINECMNEWMNEGNIFFSNKYTSYVLLHPYYHEYIISFSKRSWEEILQIYFGGYQEKIFKTVLTLISFSILF